MFAIMENETERETFRDLHDAHQHLAWCRSQYPSQSSRFWIMRLPWPWED